MFPSPTRPYQVHRLPRTAAVVTRNPSAADNVGLMSIVSML
jgi:hypothetical protein